MVKGAGGKKRLALVRAAVARGGLAWDEARGVLHGVGYAPIAVRRVGVLRRWRYVPGVDGGGEANDWAFYDWRATADLDKALRMARRAWRRQRERLEEEARPLCPFWLAEGRHCVEERCAWWVAERDGEPGGCAFEVAARHSVLLAGVYPWGRDDG